MSGRFMKVKRLILPTLTLVIIASQLMGCAAASQSELLQMLEQGRQIEIEIATPISEKQGEEKTIDWIQLDELTTYDSFRKQLDDIMKIIPYGNGSKNGICYINLDGQQEGNNTLFNAMMNRKFVTSFYENDTANLELQQIMDSIYTDTDENNYMTAAINAYWNLLPDAEPNYFNGGSTLSRLEAMSLLARATTPVEEKIGNQSFTDAVGQSDFTDLASLVADDSYLTTADKSLNETTANGTISRGEYIYMLINNIFGADRISSADTKKASFNDCKSAGDIASQQKLSEEDTSKDYYDSAELKFTLDNPDNGCPDKMFHALVTAQELGIISSDTRWDEGLTKSEAIQLYLDTLQAYTNENGYPVDAVRGQGTGTDELESAYASSESEGTKQEYEITEMNEQMQATENAGTYEQPNNETKISVVQKDEVVTVIGKVEGYNWYKIEQADGIQSYIDGVYLKEIKQIEKSEQTESQPEVQQPQPQTEQQPEIQQEQAPQEEEQSSTNEHINPQTGEPLKPGDIVGGDGSLIYTGDFSNVDDW